MNGVQGQIQFSGTYHSSVIFLLAAERSALKMAGVGEVLNWSSSVPGTDGSGLKEDLFHISAWGPGGAAVLGLDARKKGGRVKSDQKLGCP